MYGIPSTFLFWLQAIAAFGGYRAVAERMGWQMSRRPRGFWKSLDEVAPSFAQVAASLAEDSGGALGMPSRAQLRALGRTDLLHVLAKHSTEAVASAAGLQLNGACLTFDYTIVTCASTTAQQRRLMERHQQRR